MRSQIDAETRIRIERAVEELSERDYPRVWIGEEGITADELLTWQLINDEDRRSAWEDMSTQGRNDLWQEMPDEVREALPEQAYETPPEHWEDLPETVRAAMRAPLEVEPGERVELENTGMGVWVPDVSIRWLEGRWVLENMPESLPDFAAELDWEVLYIRAAKEGKVPIIYDNREWMEAGLGPLIELKAMEELTRLDVDELTPERVRDRYMCRLQDLEFYAMDTMGPYVIEDSERARQALEQRLSRDNDD